MINEPFYRIVTGMSTLHAYLESSRVRASIDDFSRRKNILELAGGHEDLANVLLSNGTRTGLKRHLMGLRATMEQPSYRRAMSYISDEERTALRIYDAITEVRLVTKPVVDIDDEAYMNALGEISHYSGMIAKGFPLYVERYIVSGLRNRKT